MLRDGKGADFLYEKLMSNLTAIDVSPDTFELLNLPWRRIYTTNYDNGVEIARNVKSQRVSRVPEDDVSHISRGDIVHINGYIKRVTPANVGADLSLTDASYADRRFEMSPWYRVFRTDIVAARAVIFAGYSLYDLDITRALSDASISGKTFFFLRPDVDPIDASSISRYGGIIDGGVEGLIYLLREALQDYKPNSSDSAFLSLRKLSIKAGLDNSPVELLDRQLIFGALPEDEVLAGEGPFDGSRYVVPRTQELEALDALKRGLARDILITGELASGKSATALSISSHFLREGYDVYVVTRGPTLNEEMRTLGKIDRKIVLVVEGYGDFRDELYEYVRSRSGLHRLVMTEQTVAHQFTENFIQGEVFANQVYEITLDHITVPDATKLAELVNFAGLWGERSGSSISSLSNFLIGYLEGSMYRLLLEIIESEQVKRRIDELLRPLFYDAFATRIFVTACVTNRIGVSFNPSDWAGLFEPGRVRRVMSNHRTSLENFLNISGSRVFGRTGLMSFSVLKRVPDKALVLE